MAFCDVILCHYTKHILQRLFGNFTSANKGNGGIVFWFSVWLSVPVHPSVDTGFD